MSIILNNSRDVGNKFLFGHFMMKNSTPITKIKFRDFSKYIIYPYRPAAWWEMSADNPLDWKMDGDVFVTERGGKKCKFIKGECRTWRVIHGNHSPWNSTDYVTNQNIRKYLNKEITDEILGIALDMEGDAFTHKQYWDMLKDELERKEDKVGRRLPLVGVPNPKWFEPDTPGLKDFDAMMFWQFSWGVGEDSDDGENIHGFKACIKWWHNHGYENQIGIIQDQYRDYDGCVGKDEWKNIVDYAIDVTDDADKGEDTIPFASFALHKAPSSSGQSLANELKAKYVNKWPDAKPAYLKNKFGYSIG